MNDYETREEKNLNVEKRHVFNEGFKKKIPTTSERKDPMTTDQKSSKKSE
ncbi:hypothetical protein ACLOEZ_10300 [Levilactobacillus brevis]